MSEMIRLENVTFGYDEGQTVLKDYSLKINQGEFVTILGHNGSGKSTLSKLLVGLIEAQAGKIFVDGQPLNEETVFEIRQKIGIVFQNPDNQLIGNIVEEDVAFGSYGWGDGEWMRTWEDTCRNDGASLVCDSVICQEAPDDDALNACRSLGEALA